MCVCVLGVQVWKRKSMCIRSTASAGVSGSTCPRYHQQQDSPDCPCHSDPEVSKLLHLPPTGPTHFHLLSFPCSYCHYYYQVGKCTDAVVLITDMAKVGNVCVKEQVGVVCFTTAYLCITLYVRYYSLMLSMLRLNSGS